MRHAIGLALLACALAFGLACSQDSAHPTAPALADTASPFQAMTAEANFEKQFICHYNSADDPYGVVVEVTTRKFRRHDRHENDCILEPGEWENNQQCFPGNCAT